MIISHSRIPMISGTRINWKNKCRCLDAQTNAESALNSKSEAVILNIEEVKNLIQLLAVNELLDEINAEERTQ